MAKKEKIKNEGYCHCACRDCFEIASFDSNGKAGLCWECEEAGCSGEEGDECCSPHAYGCSEFEDEE